MAFHLHKLKGVLHPWLKISMFYVLSQIIDTFWKIMYAPYCKLSKELKNGIEIFLGQVAFNLWIKTENNVLINSSTQELLGLLNFSAIF